MPSLKNVKCLEYVRSLPELVRQTWVFQGQRGSFEHETMKYGPDVDIAKDEMTHETYWQYVRFIDPYTEEEQEEFGHCNHYYKYEEHETE
ncbi:hypothetical protein KI387_002873, partial [Taxus chinensis]